MKNIIIILGLATIILSGCTSGRKAFNPIGNDTLSPTTTALHPGKNKVEYLCNGSKIVADLYIPTDYKEGEKRPAIVITPPNTGVKEQTAGIYAKRLAEKGFITLAFDPRGFGESSGFPLLFDLNRQVEDVRSSVDFISTLEQVDTNNLFNMGICVGTGISVAETVTDPRIKAQAMVSPTFRDMEEDILPMPKWIAYSMGGFAKGWYRITKRNMKIKPLVREVAEEDANEDSIGVQMGAFYYLPGMPGDVPTWENALSMTSMRPVVDWVDFFVTAEKLNSTPLYMVYGTGAFSRHSAIKYYEMVNGSKDKLVLENGGHFDLYWMPEYVKPAVEGIDKFFKQNIH